MVKIGITGQSGFIGYHMFNFLGLQENVERIQFEDEYFNSDKKLRDFVKKCDVIIHLAAVNRHEDPKVIFDTNIHLVDQLIEAMEVEKVTPHVLFSSSSQENRDNPYGQSKKIGREKLIDWAKRNNSIFTGLVIPNVFGPFCKPYYNSVIATFSHQLTHNENPRIINDTTINLIYIDELVKEIYKSIDGKINQNELIVKHTSEFEVSGILEKLVHFKELYFDQGIFPEIETNFELNLFNTFRCYIDHKKFFPNNLIQHTDNRGSFVETVKTEVGGQFSFSTSLPDITRGNHFHTRKIERFIVIKGKARIQLRQIGTTEILNFEIDGKQPSFVDMPIWFTHNITNIGHEELLTLFWINEFFNPDDPDTYFEPVIIDS